MRWNVIWRYSFGILTVKIFNGHFNTKFKGKLYNCAIGIHLYSDYGGLFHFIIYFLAEYQSTPMVIYRETSGSSAGHGR